MAYYSPMHLPLALMGIGAVGVFSLFMRRKGTGSSWPTWVLVPLAVLVSLPLGGESKPPDPLRPFCLLIIGLVLARWAFALARRERDRTWIFYLLILVGGPLVILPMVEGLSPKLLP